MEILCILFVYVKTQNISILAKTDRFHYINHLYENKKIISIIK